MFSKVLFVLALTALARMAGGGFYARLLNKKGNIDEATHNDKGGLMPINLSMLPEVVFGLLFGFGFYGLLQSIPHFADLPNYVIFFWALSVAGWSYAWMEASHGIALPWGRPISPELLADLKTRKNFITPIADYISNKFNISKFTKEDLFATETVSVSYCRLFMAIKGFIIGLPFGGIPFAIAWPLSYELGARAKRQELAELSTGFYSGIIILGIVALVQFIFN